MTTLQERLRKTLTTTPFSSTSQHTPDKFLVSEADIKDAADAIDILVEALEYYAWHDHWKRDDGYEYHLSEMETDQGGRARAILAKYKAGSE